ncbi:hypothetical protein [Streptomyces melanogenes]
MEDDDPQAAYIALPPKASSPTSWSASTPRGSRSARTSDSSWTKPTSC